jgi:rubrerythrin
MHMGEIRSRRKGCPFCGNMHIYEVVCVLYDGVEEEQVPEAILKGRSPVFTRIIDSDGALSHEESVQYCHENKIERGFEKQYFFEPPVFRGASDMPATSCSSRIDLFWKCKECLRTWSPLSRKRFAKCPNCGMSSGVQIMYGFPSHMGFRSMGRGEVRSGGCCIDLNNPTWACKECGHEWGGADLERRLLDLEEEEGRSH